MVEVANNSCKISFINLGAFDAKKAQDIVVFHKKTWNGMPQESKLEPNYVLLFPFSVKGNFNNYWLSSLSHIIRLSQAE